MQAMYPDGTEELFHGSEDELKKIKVDILKEQPKARIKNYKEGDEITMNNGTILTVTARGLKAQGLTKNQRKGHRKKCRGKHGYRGV